MTSVYKVLQAPPNAILGTVSSIFHISFLTKYQNLFEIPGICFKILVKFDYLCNNELDAL